MRRYVAGKISRWEKIKTETWLGMTKVESGDDHELGSETEERILRKIIPNPTDDVIVMRPDRRGLKGLVTRRWIGIAASVVLCISIVLWNSLNNSSALQVMASVDKEKHILGDGTIVWLQRGSKLIYDQADGERRAALVGEAFFEVAKMPNSPFTIACGGINVKVLGTSFRLKTRQEGIELNVLTGKVNLSTHSDTTGIDVAPNEKVTYTIRGAVARQALGNEEVSEIIAGTEYSMLFENTTMDSVVEQISRKFDVSIQVVDKHLLRCRVTVDLTDNSLDNTLAMLTHLLNVSYQIEDKEVVLSGMGCEALK